MTNNQSLIYLLRHGKSVHNKGDETTHRFAGNKVDLPLTLEGIKNAVHLSNILKNKNLKAIISSPLLRSYQTAEIIKDNLNSNPKHIVINELYEINIGDFAGHNEQEVNQLFPGETKAFYDGNIEDWDFPNGEKYTDVIDRIRKIIKSLNEILQENPRIAIVGHGMINRVIMHYLRMSERDWKPRSYPHGKIIKIKI